VPRAPQANFTLISSDPRTKEAVEEWDLGLTEICNLQPISFCFNGLAGTPADGKRHVGLDGASVHRVMPECAETRQAKLRLEDASETDIATYNPSPLLYALINAVKTLDARLAAIEAR
jgi:hypothetical protein